MKSEDALDLRGLGDSPSSVVIAEVVVSSFDWTTLNWLLGPLPIQQAANATTRARGHSANTDEVARRTLIDAQQGDVLYGKAEGLHRYYRRGEEPILALELLITPQVSFVAMHVAVPPLDSKAATMEHRSAVAAAIRSHDGSQTEFWRRAQQLLGPAVTLAAASPVKALHFESDPAMSGDEVLVTAYGLVSGSSSAEPADLLTRALRHVLTIHRPDWSALVLRDGAAFVAHQTSREPFADSLRVLTHSVYVDALLFALLQRRLVDESGARAVRAPLNDPTELVELERRQFDFKRSFWRTSLTAKRTAPVDEVLREFQAQLLTERDLLDVAERVQDGARLALSSFSERQEAAQQRLNRMVQNASVIIGAFALSFTAAPVIAQPSWKLFFSAAVVGVVTMMISFAALYLTGRRVAREPPRSARS